MKYAIGSVYILERLTRERLVWALMNAILPPGHILTNFSRNRNVALRAVRNVSGRAQDLR
jgi:hypothetical protein